MYIYVYTRVNGTYPHYVRHKKLNLRPARRQGADIKPNAASFKSLSRLCSH